MTTRHIWWWWQQVRRGAPWVTMTLFRSQHQQRLLTNQKLKNYWVPGFIRTWSGQSISWTIRTVWWGPWLTELEPWRLCERLYTVILACNKMQAKSPKYIYTMFNTNYSYKTRQADSGMIRSTRKPKLDLATDSFNWRAADLFNQLPTNIRNMKNPQNFQLATKQWVRENIEIWRVLLVRGTTLPPPAYPGWMFSAAPIWRYSTTFRLSLRLL